MKTLFRIIYKIGVKLLTGTHISKYSFVQKIIEKTNRTLKPEFVEIEGNRIYLDKQDSLFLSIRGYHEKTATRIARGSIKEGDTVIDIGANIGYYTLLFAKWVGPTGKVYAFEPEPTNFQLLEKNVKANNYKNITIFQKAVSDKNDKLSFYISDESSAANQLFKPQKFSQIIDVDSVKLDECLPIDEKIDFIKLDIQGAEGTAIKGMNSILKNNSNTVIMQEWWPDAIKKYGMDSDEHLKILEKLGYSFYEIDGQNDKTNPITINQLMQKYPNEFFEDINLLCKKKLMR
jgi:FkbM family methyltransferase